MLDVQFNSHSIPKRIWSFLFKNQRGHYCDFSLRKRVWDRKIEIRKVGWMMFGFERIIFWKNLPSRGLQSLLFPVRIRVSLEFGKWSLLLQKLRSCHELCLFSVSSRKRSMSSVTFSYCYILLLPKVKTPLELFSNLWDRKKIGLGVFEKL